MTKFIITCLALLASVTLSAQETNQENKMASNTKVLIETNKGTIEITLYPKIAPKAVENFVTHAKDGYYNGTVFHRVIKDFMIQGGDPKGNGTGGESIWGKPFEDEYDADLTFDKKGLLAMANRGPTTNGSQFFITTAPTPWLNNRHTIFGKVTKGDNVVEEIENSKTGAQDRPVEEIKIKKMTVVESN